MQRAIMMHKRMNNNALSYLSNLFTEENGHSSYNLCSSDQNVDVPAVRTECNKRSFAVSASSLWNSLPNSLKCEPSLWKFKDELKHSTILH